MNEYPHSNFYIEATKKWIRDVVIGCNFCPFASKPVKVNTVRYQIDESQQLDQCLEVFINECKVLDQEELIETTLIIYPNQFGDFNDYLDFLSLAEQLIRSQKYTGIYQVASFHPAYCFAGEDPSDASNYTNRSPFPMLHLLREARLEEALDKFPHADQIPENNIRFTRTKGAAYMKMLVDACLA